MVDSVTVEFGSVTGWLDAVGLPWGEKRGELGERFGVNADNPYQWDLVSLDVNPPPLAGMLWPFNFQMFPEFSPDLPPVRLSTHVSIGDDPEANIQWAAAQFAQHIGSRNVITKDGVRQAVWHCGAASIKLRVWLESQRSFGPNPAHQLDPRLNAACSVEIWTGWRPSLNPQEQDWLDGFVPQHMNSSWLTEPSTPARPEYFYNEGQLEFMRELPANMSRYKGAVGFSADKMALICCYNVLFVIPVNQISSFEVFRTLPAKGPGGSSLIAHCLTGYPAFPLKNVCVAKGTKADDLNEAAKKLAGCINKPLKINNYDDDA